MEDFYDLAEPPPEAVYDDPREPSVFWGSLRAEAYSESVEGLGATASKREFAIRHT